MTTKQKRLLKLKVLDYVNGLRKTLDLPKLRYLPKGVHSNNQLCPIAKAIKGTVYTFSGCVGKKEQDVLAPHETKWPKYVVKFITAVDDGEFPELLVKN